VTFRPYCTLLLFTAVFRSKIKFTKMFVRERLRRKFLHFGKVDMVLSSYEKKMWWKPFVELLWKAYLNYTDGTWMKYSQKNLLKAHLLVELNIEDWKLCFKTFWKITNILSKCNIAFWYFFLFSMFSCISDISPYQEVQFSQGGIVKFRWYSIQHRKLEKL
jgi:hypothetical protein